MADYVWGIDVSHHQNPTKVNYEGLVRNGCRFVYARALYGLSPDNSAREHVKRARAFGLSVGLYSFFISTIGSAAQAESIIAAHAELGVGEGDLAPVLDVENELDRHGNTVRTVSKLWASPVQDILSTVGSRFGDAILYCSESVVPVLGKAISDYPLWVAKYRGEGESIWPPASVATKHVCHQYGVAVGLSNRGIQARSGLGALDRNWANWPLPTITISGSAKQGVEIPLTERVIGALAADAAIRGIRNG